MKLKKKVLIGLTIGLLFVAIQSAFGYTDTQHKINCAHPTTLLENVVCTIYGFIT